MTSRLLILRPEPGASETAARAQAAGWAVDKVPLFNVLPLDWDAPDPAGFDAAVMTSAHAARLGGLAAFRDLPLYAVGERTAAAAREAGFETIVTGSGGAEAIAEMLRRDGRKRIFHPCGAETRPFDESGLEILHLPVYAAEPAEPGALRDAIGESVIALLHSPRAARLFAAHCDRLGIARRGISLAAISKAALAEAGSGWKRAVSAERPRDDAMLAAAARLASSL
ncbi:uroporphyrinogen-III synthase [Parasphingopyxis marina]|uniref:Uroporphyrinogen-III synthase n=1 Tax=Parasphingopyxis marina TaxID=2761622 RepID=A0A842HUX5_9SPHN|nr:uroporphyrinogen-III synthase [Parasphingopyxis marina]MBC2776323.1 uroporphyrinogen-III synthase [Parasphingopyxis marina]